MPNNTPTKNLSGNCGCFYRLPALSLESLESQLMKLILKIATKRRRSERPPPLLIEVFEETNGELIEEYSVFPFIYSLRRMLKGDAPLYGVRHDLSPRQLVVLRRAVQQIGAELSPSFVEPLTFERLVEVLEQLAAKYLGESDLRGHTKELATLSAYEAIGMSRILALAMDNLVTEFYVDSVRSPAYLDHYKYGRCESAIFLTERERKAIETHLDTFRGYTLDYTLPSLKNDLDVGGNRLRVSLDLAPLSVNGFSLDVRRLSVATLSLIDLVECGMISEEAAGFLVAWLEAGMNVTITGETGTGKTTLLNALDEALDPRLRRIYIEDAVETKDLLDRGFHQMKIRVDPFERANEAPRTKGVEIIKILHRSPDLVILSEIQSEEHSHAFFHALSSGIKGLQTFHAGSPEQAIRRWVEVHGIPEQSLLDLGLIVQMKRPDRLKPMRFVSRICEVASENGEARLRDVFVRDRESKLERILPWERIELRGGEASPVEFRRRTEVLVSGLSLRRRGGGRG